jgi:hypothetical protein
MFDREVLTRLLGDEKLAGGGLGERMKAEG